MGQLELLHELSCFWQGVPASARDAVQLIQNGDSVTVTVEALQRVRESR